jgi:osomolarity two-component system, sensor histidine kinase NIK1
MLSDNAKWNPFRTHLVALLSIYELGPFPGTPIPRYEGPSDWQTEAILKTGRMYSAEETVGEPYSGVLRH